MSESDGMTMSRLEYRLAVELGATSSVPERLEAVWREYESSTGVHLDRPVAARDRAAVAQWLRRRAAGDPPESLLVRARRLQPLLHIDMVSKVGTISQLPCAVHHGTEIETTPYSVHFSVEIDPWSAQSAREKVEIGKAVTREMTRRSSLREPFSELLCVSITALVSGRRRRQDLDNIAKGFFDAIEGYLYVNDRQIACLTVRRIEFDGADGSYTVTARPIAPWNHDVISDDGRPLTSTWGRVRRKRGGSK